MDGALKIGRYLGQIGGTGVVDVCRRGAASGDLPDAPVAIRHHVVELAALRLHHLSIVPQTAPRPVDVIAIHGTISVPKLKILLVHLRAKTVEVHHLCIGERQWVKEAVKQQRCDLLIPLLVEVDSVGRQLFFTTGHHLARRLKKIDIRDILLLRNASGRLRVAA